MVRGQRTSVRNLVRRDDDCCHSPRIETIALFAALKRKFAIFYFNQASTKFFLVPKPNDVV